MSLHVERVGDEVLLSVQDEDGTTVVSLPVPEGVDELIDALVEARGAQTREPSRWELRRRLLRSAWNNLRGPVARDDSGSTS